MNEIIASKMEIVVYVDTENAVVHCYSVKKDTAVIESGIRIPHLIALN